MAGGVKVRRPSKSASVLFESLEDRRLLSATFGIVKPFLQTDGQLPLGPLVADSAGNLYGVTQFGGANNLGVIYELIKAPNQTYFNYSALAAFDASTGGNPLGGLAIDSAGNLFGTTSNSSAGSDGAIFELVKDSGTITPLATFDGATTGTSPVGALVLDGIGNLYGVTSKGGAKDDGTVFELRKDNDGSFSTDIQLLATFNGTNGAAPAAGLAIDASGNLFGTTSGGGSSSLGTIFEITSADRSTIQTLLNLDNNTGYNPQSTPLVDNSGALYATTVGSGGSIIKLVISNRTYTTVVKFDSNTSNSSSPGSLIFDRSGNGAIYGTTGSFSGDSGDSIFTIPAGGAYVTLTPTNVRMSYGLYQDAQGNIFGVQPAGGYENNYGAVVEYGNAVPPRAAGIAFQSEAPVTALTGQPVTSGLTAVVNDSAGQVATSLEPLIHLSIAGGPDGGTLGGTVDQLAANGVANFNDITFSAPGTYTLDISDGTGDPSQNQATVIVADPDPNATPGLTPTVLQSTLPTAVVAGKKAKGVVNVQLQNNTQAVEKGLDTVELFATATGQIDANSIVIGQLKKRVNLVAGQTTTWNVPVRKFSPAAGTYIIAARATNVAGTQLASSTGPTIVSAAAFVSLTPTISTVQLPANIVAGAKTTGSIKVVVTNNGNIPSKGRATFTISATTTPGDPGITVATITLPVSVAAGKSKTISLPVKNLPALPSGNYYFVVSVEDSFSKNTNSAITDSTTAITGSVITLTGKFQSFTGNSALISLTNSGNVDDASQFSATPSWAADAAGTSLAATGQPAIVAEKLVIRSGKTAKVRVTGWKSLMSNLPAGGAYYPAVTITDAAGNSVTIVATDPTQT